MKKKYNDCFYCGGQVKEQHMPRELRWQGQLFIVENVPLGICIQCGEKVIRPDVAKAIDRVLHGKKKPSKTIQVPVYQYEKHVA